MPRYKLIIEYDGTDYSGWQRQDDRPSVQVAIEEAIFKFCGVETKIVGAGRTDAGVHALAQVAHADLPKEFDPFRVMQGINFYLFNARHSVSHEVAAQELLGSCADADAPRRMTDNRIAILHAEQVADDFSARFSANKRHYLYRIVNRRARLALDATRAWNIVDDLDVDAMHTAGGYLVGHHDFTSFRDSKCQAKSPVKTLEQLDIKRDGEEIQIVTSARSFLHHQVRIMAGTLVLVGRGKWRPDDVKKALEAKNRAAAGPTAPPDGLYLTKVDY